MCGINAIGAQGCSCMSTFCHAPLKIALLLHKMANGPYSLSETVCTIKLHNQHSLNIGSILSPRASRCSAVSVDKAKVYRSTRYVFIHCLWLKIEFYVNLKPWIIDPAIYNANLETLAKLDTFWYFSKILGDFLKSSVITPLRIVSVCRYGERDMSTFK